MLFLIPRLPLSTRGNFATRSPLEVAQADRARDMSLAEFIASANYPITVVVTSNRSRSPKDEFVLRQGMHLKFVRVSLPRSWFIVWGGCKVADGLRSQLTLAILFPFAIKCNGFRFYYFFQLKSWLEQLTSRKCRHNKVYCVTQRARYKHTMVRNTQIHV